jgi:hypothetical protein
MMRWWYGQRVPPRLRVVHSGLFSHGRVREGIQSHSMDTARLVSETRQSTIINQESSNPTAQNPATS